MSGANSTSVRRVRFPLPLLPGESIRGYVWRVAEHNTYERPAQLLETGGVRLLDLWSGNVDVRALSELYGVEFEALDHATPRRVENEAALAAFGMSYSVRAMRRLSCPVSPGGLQRSRHHRFAWSCRRFSFCPEDFSLLLFKCPSQACGQPLLWWNGPIDSCATCGFDLKTAKVLKIQREHQPYLGVAASLVSFDAQVRRESLDRFPEFMGALKPFDVLEVVLAIGRALQEAGHPLAKAPKLSERYPVAMLAGMRLMLDQDAQYGFGSDVMTAPPGYVAKARQRLGQGSTLATGAVQYALARVRAETILFHSPRADDNAINLTEAARRLGVERKVARKLVSRGILRGQPVGGGSVRVLRVIEEGSLADLVHEADSRISVAHLAERYGLKSSWILEMVSLGLIKHAQSPFTDAAYKDVQLRKDSAIAYLDRVTGAIVRTGADDPDRVLLRDVFVLLGPGSKPWLQAIMTPKLLPDGLGSFEPHGVNCSALTVTRRCARMLQSGEFRFPPCRVSVSSDISLSDAEEHLNCYPRDIAKLIRIGALLRSDRGVCMQSVEACARTLISTRELAARALVPAADFALVAAERGLQRISRGLGFWDRQRAEAVFGLRGSRG